jgi:hypothetical protein
MDAINKPGAGDRYKHPCLRPAFSPHLGVCGGVEEDRTPDLRIANATLSQLSYHPVGSRGFYRKRASADNEAAMTSETR